MLFIVKCGTNANTFVSEVVLFFLWEMPFMILLLIIPHFCTVRNRSVWMVWSIHVILSFDPSNELCAVLVQAKIKEKTRLYNGRNLYHEFSLKSDIRHCFNQSEFDHRSAFYGKS